MRKSFVSYTLFRVVRYCHQGHAHHSTLPSVAYVCTFQVESNGTVLSTNWKEVGSKVVEGNPPDGMEVKKWEY